MTDQVFQQAELIEETERGLVYRGHIKPVVMSSDGPIALPCRHAWAIYKGKRRHVFRDNDKQAKNRHRVTVVLKTSNKAERESHG